MEKKKMLISVTLSEMNLRCDIAMSNPLTQNQSTIIYMYMYIVSMVTEQKWKKERKEKDIKKNISGTILQLTLYYVTVVL